MSIVFACACGKQFKAKDDSIGKGFACPVCGARLTVPEPNVFREPAPFVDTPPITSLIAPVEKRRPLIGPGFFRDPVVLIGGVFPAFVLIAFGTYLYRDHSARSFRGQVLAMKAEADGLFASDRELAYEKYGQLIAFMHNEDPGDDDCRQALFAARKNRDHLFKAIKPIIEARKAEAERLAVAKSEADAINAEAKRLASLSANLSGGAWIERKNGSSEVIRGLRLSLIPWRASKDRIQPILDVASNIEWMRDSIKIYDKLAPGGTIDLMPISLMAHLTVEGAQGNSRQKYEAHVAEDLWPLFVKNYAVAEAVTNVEGKYKFGNIVGGRYYLCGRHVSDLFFVEWVVPVVVDRSGEISQDVHTSNAYVIQNKFGE